jgi:hypothetical protein
MKIGILGLFAGFLVIVLAVSVGALIFVLNSDDVFKTESVATNNTDSVVENKTSAEDNAGNNGNAMSNEPLSQGGEITSADINVVAESLLATVDQESALMNQDEGETSINAQTQAVIDASNTYE